MTGDEGGVMGEEGECLDYGGPRLLGPASVPASW